VLSWAKGKKEFVAPCKPSMIPLQVTFLNYVTGEPWSASRGSVKVPALVDSHDEFVFQFIVGLSEQPTVRKAFTEASDSSC
jgi:hypothetical protein